jgi:hypothetical protein
MAACGFEARSRRHHFEGEVQALLDNITPLLERLRRRAAFEAPAIVPLAQAPLEELGWLVSRELGGGPMGALARLRRLTRPGSGALDRSQVAMIDEEVAGVILWRLEADGAAAVEARVVASRWRGGPINLLLLEAGLLGGKAQGVTRVRFHCDDGVADTLSLARRARAEELSVLTSYYYRFAPV